MPQVKDVMSTEVVTAEPQERIVGAAQKMVAEAKEPMPVVEDGQVIGVLSDRDIVSRVVAEGHDPQSVHVQDVDTGDLVAIGPDQDVDEARRLMDQNGLDRLPVIDEEGHLLGIVSRANLATSQD